MGTARGRIPAFKRRAKLPSIADWLCYNAAVYRRKDFPWSAVPTSRCHAGIDQLVTAPISERKADGCIILVFTLGIMLAIGVPVAYAVGISAIIGAWYIDIPLEAVMIN